MAKAKVYKINRRLLKLLKRYEKSTPEERAAMLAEYEEKLDRLRELEYATIIAILKGNKKE